MESSRRWRVFIRDKRQNHIRVSLPSRDLYFQSNSINFKLCDRVRQMVNCNAIVSRDIHIYIYLALLIVDKLLSFFNDNSCSNEYKRENEILIFSHYSGIKISRLFTCLHLKVYSLQLHIFLSLVFEYIWWYHFYS